MIALEKFEQQDFQQLIDWISDEFIMMKWAGSLFRYPLKESSLQWYISKTNIPRKSSAFVYKALETESGTTVGHISLGSISWKNKSARITRVFIGNNARNRGYCQQMIKAVLKIAFDDLKLHRVDLGVYDDNKAALACYERSGLKVEGLSRDILCYKNSWWSMIEMSILENEWKALTSGESLTV